jgi:hypothetical protein
MPYKVGVIDLLYSSCTTNFHKKGSNRLAFDASSKKVFFRAEIWIGDEIITNLIFGKISAQSSLFS